MKKITVEAPCKINLALDIVRRRADGYHEMDMVMQSVGLCDRVTIEKVDLPQISMSCNLKALPCDDQNIVVRCAKAFFEKTGIDPSVHIHLSKKIPMMAGLGGGSADGAGVLVGLNRLYDAGLSVEELCKIGFSCGADIPFCIRGKTLRAQGAGEILSELPPFPKEGGFILIAKPTFSVSTKLAFEGFDRQEHPVHGDVLGMIDALRAGDLQSIAARLSNVFEPFCNPQEISRIKQTMQAHHAMGSLMSGSGSAVFALFEKKEDALCCRKTLSPQMEQVEVVKAVNHGPLVVSEE